MRVHERQSFQTRRDKLLVTVLSKKTQALELALETRSALFSEKVSLGSILGRCNTICKILNREEEYNWIQKELSGYKEDTIKELLKKVPEYRRVHVIFRDSFGRFVALPDELNFLHDYPLYLSISEIEDYIDGSLQMVGGPLIHAVRKHIYHDISHALIANIQIKKVIGAVKNRALEFLNDIIIELSGLDEMILNKETIKVDLPIIEKYDKQTEIARLLLYDLENRLRKFVDSKNPVIKNSFKNDWESSKKKEHKPWRKPIKHELIHYSHFEQLRLIITQNENWSKIFFKYFGRPEGIISRLNELDSLRDTIAHNRRISDFDFDALKIIYRQLLACIEEKPI